MRAAGAGELRTAVVPGGALLVLQHTVGTWGAGFKKGRQECGQPGSAWFDPALLSVLEHGRCRASCRQHS